jgi:hypothetical protein
VTIASIVEGYGEVTALPKLLHRLAADSGVSDLRTPQPHREQRGKLIAAGGIARAVTAQAFRVRGAGGVLVLLDADDDCPAHLGPVLLARAQATRPDICVSVVLAMREFEAWFLAAAPSLAGSHGLRGHLSAPVDPEGLRDAKGWLTRHRESGQPYKPTVDQAVLASAFDLKSARVHSPSFDKFCREAESLIRRAMLIR